MYQTSPMEKFNKNNPFIIIAKRKYDNITDDIQDFGKDFLLLIFIQSIISLLCTGFCAYLASVTGKDIIITIPLVSALIIIIQSFTWREQAAYFVTLHPAMKEFERLCNLEVNDILVLNNEDIMACIQGLYQLHGELITTKKYYTNFQKFYIFIESLVTIWIMYVAIF